METFYYMDFSFGDKNFAYVLRRDETFIYSMRHDTYNYLEKNNMMHYIDALKPHAKFRIEHCIFEPLPNTLRGGSERIYDIYKNRYFYLISGEVKKNIKNHPEYADLIFHYYDCLIKFFSEEEDERKMKKLEIAIIVSSSVPDEVIESSLKFIFDYDKKFYLRNRLAISVNKHFSKFNYKRAF